MTTEKRVTILEPISSQVIYDNTTEAPKLKVAAYARVSTEQDEQQSSYEAQVNYYNQYIRNNLRGNLSAFSLLKYHRDNTKSAMASIV
jgi:predicted site-specific integrase-resolvase